MREATRICLWVNYKQVAAGAQDKVDINVNRLHSVRLGVLAYGNDEFGCCQRPKGTHDPLERAFRDGRSAAGLGADRSEHLGVCLLEAYRQFSEPRPDVALAPQLQELTELQCRPLEPTCW
jgi:hypothetical protein